MNYKELIKGEIYSSRWMNDSSLYYIFKATKDCNNCSHIETNGKSRGNQNGSFSIPANIYLEATPQEKEHFLQCEKAGKYVEYKPEIVEYQIY